MASAQLMEEELQKSVMVSEADADAEFEEAVDDDLVGDTTHYTDQDAPGEDVEEDDEDMDGEEEEEEEEGEEDAEGEEVDQEDAQEAEGSEESDNVSEDDGQEDAEVEDDIIVDEDAEADEEDDEEGVGAVKLRPGQTDDESEASGSEASHGESDNEWEDGVGPEEEEDDDESEAALPNHCMFCKQEEDNDPSEEFEAYLTCTGCGENSHQQCARDKGALSEEQDTEAWKCLECSEVSVDGVSVIDDAGLNGIVDAGSPPAARRATAPKLARDLLPSHRGAVKPDSHSVFNQLVLDEDPMDGSRVLRKRKTSSAEADDQVLSLRKRRKNTDDEQSDDDNNPAEEVEEDSRPRSSRSLRLKISTHAPATVIKKTRSSLVVRFRVNPADLKEIVSQKPKPRKQRGGRRVALKKEKQPKPAGRSRRAANTAEALIPPFASSNYSQPFYSFFDKDMDELKGKPYGGILTEAEADTSKTLPANEDRRRFDEAKQKAEDDWKERMEKMQAEIEVPVRKPKKTDGPASRIECIEFGGWEIDTWYAAPYPEEYSRNRVLFICEFCLKYMNSDYVAWRHKLKCPAKHPPGDEIYRHNSISVFEVDGRKNPVYCQNLCLLAKLFLGSKTLYYDVEPFLFYVLCEYDDLGYHFVGYFSKEKRASSQNNVSCILTLPIHQRKGYGNLLIDFSYLLTRVEGKTGSPEKPLSDMGLVSYRNYWRLILCRYLLDQVAEDRREKRGLSVKKISDDTGLTSDDVISALEGLRCLVRDPQTQLYAFRVDIDYCKQYVAKWEAKNYVQLTESALTWTPYVMGRSNATNFEIGPGIHAIAPRDDEDEQKAVEAVVEDILQNGEHAQIAVPVKVNGVDHDAAKMDVDPTTILESTEPNEKTDDTPMAEDAAEDVANIATMDGAADAAVPEKSAEAVTNTASVNGSGAGDQPSLPVEEPREDEWTLPYHNVPPTRFVAYPPVNGLKRLDNRIRAAAAQRPSVPRVAGPSRPKVRRSVGVRRSTTSKPKNNSARRKAGGTGRGPGRWPKGTKKSDYGNADSGPGLPPAWVEKRLTSSQPEGSNGSKDPDTVQVKRTDDEKTPGKSQKNGVNGNGKGKSLDADVAMAGVEDDVDA